MVAVLFLGLGATSKIEKRASEFNEAFKGRDVNKTIARVEAILSKNPLLPRLTRGEILALFDNITRTDALKHQQVQSKDVKQESKDKPEKEKSLMVVLPFSANNDQSDSGLEELYTRQPVTRIVGQDNTTPTPSTTSSTAKPNRPKKRKNGPRRKPTNPPHQEIRPVYVEENKNPTMEARPVDVNSNWKPVTEDTKSKQHINLGFEVPQHMKDTLDTFQNSNNQVFVTVPPQAPARPQQTNAKPVESPSALPNISIAAQSLTPELKNLLVSLGLLNPDGSQVQTPLKTTTTTHSPPPLIQYISINPTVDPASYFVFKPLPVARGNHRGNNEEELSDDMRHFLANFGLTSDTETYRSQKALKSKNTEMSSSTTTTSTTTSTELPLKSSEKKVQVADSSNDGFSIPDFNSDPFTDEMKDVLENIGLMKKPRRKSKGVIFNPATRTAGLLNQSEEKEKVSKLLSTIKELSAAEKNKSLSTEEITAQLQNITATLVEESQEEENSDFELVEGEGSEMSYEGYEPAEEELLKLQNGFVDDELKDDSPLDLSESDKSNSNDLSVEEFSDVSKKLTGLHKSLKDSKNPPDPLSPEELNHFIENNKNEVRRQQPKNKRQQPSNSSEASNDVSSTTASSTSTTVVSTQASSDEPKSSSDSSVDAGASSDSESAAAGDQDDSTPSTDDLIDSFGGENPPENRPNGLYFLVDWNTFLRVGTDNKTVDLNFSPKVGNPKNFLPITVP